MAEGTGALEAADRHLVALAVLVVIDAPVSTLRAAIDAAVRDGVPFGRVLDALAEAEGFEASPDAGRMLSEALERN